MQNDRGLGRAAHLGCANSLSKYHIFRLVLKAVMRGSKTGGASTAEEMALLKTGLAAWLEGEPFSRIEASLGVPAAKIGVCKRARDLINQIANRQLYMVAAAASEVIRQTHVAKERVAVNPAVLETLAYAIRRGLDSPEKVAFAYRTPGARSRVLLHRAFAEKVGDRPPVPVGNLIRLGN